VARLGRSAVNVYTLLFDELLQSCPAELAESAPQVLIEPPKLYIRAYAKPQMLTNPLIAFFREYLHIIACCLFAHRPGRLI
jgi:hypothetical protein